MADESYGAGDLQTTYGGHCIDRGVARRSGSNVEASWWRWNAKPKGTKRRPGPSPKTTEEAVWEGTSRDPGPRGVGFHGDAERLERDTGGAEGRRHSDGADGGGGRRAPPSSKEGTPANSRKGSVEVLAEVTFSRERRVEKYA
jgi:hypothetical protein